MANKLIQNLTEWIKCLLNGGAFSLFVFILFLESQKFKQPTCSTLQNYLRKPIAATRRKDETDSSNHALGHLGNQEKPS